MFGQRKKQDMKHKMQVRRVFRIWSLRFMILACCILCFGSSIAFAQYSDNEVSVFPYLKCLGYEPIQPGALYLYTFPLNARVYIDGIPPEDLEWHGIAAVQHTREKKPFLAFEGLTPGTHTVRVTKSGYGTKLKYVLIEPGGAKTVRVRLHSRWQFLSGQAFVLALLTVAAGAIAINAGIWDIS